MATFNISTPVNIDSLTGKTGDDTYNINAGGYLTIDQDSRFGLNNSTSSTMGTVNLSQTGGGIEINATAVRLIPYDTGSGVVPAYNTVISQGGVSGLFIGAYSALNAAPTAVGAALPASGFIKLKQVSGGAFSAGILTGISASATAADGPGWIEIVAADNRIMTVNRLNVCKMRGDWYYFNGETTTGIRSSTYQIPTNGQTTVYFPGVWVENDIPDTYTFYPCAGTMQALANAVAVDEVRGKFCWVESSTGLVRFGSDGIRDTGGYCPPAGRKIRIPNILLTNAIGNSANNSIPNTSLISRYRFATNALGTVDFDKISMCWYPTLVNPYTATITNSCVITSINIQGAATPITLTNVGVGQETNLNTSIVNLLACNGGTITDCVFTHNNPSTATSFCMRLDNCHNFTFNNLELYYTTTRNQIGCGPITAINITNCEFNNTLLGGGRVNFITCKNVVMNDTRYFDHIALPTAHTNGPIINAVSWSRVTTVATVTSIAHGLRVGDTVAVTGSSDTAAITNATKTITSVPTLDTFTFACLNAGATSGTLNYARTEIPQPASIFTVDEFSDNIVFDGLSFPVESIVSSSPSTAIFATSSTGCTNITLQNMGTEVNPLNCGGENGISVPWTRDATVATVTRVNHKLAVNDTIYVAYSTSTSISNGNKTVTSVPTPDTFTFTMSNFGDLSGTLTYQHLVTGAVLSIPSNSYAENIAAKRCHFINIKDGFLAPGAGKSSVQIINSSMGLNKTMVFPPSNSVLKSTKSCFISQAQIGTVGTHFVDVFASEFPENTVSQSWTRSGTVVTVNSINHGLGTYLVANQINVTASSDTATIPLGIKGLVSATSVDTFAFIGVNTGSISGTIDYTPVSGRIFLLMNPPSIETNTFITLDAGSPEFTGAGTLYMPAIGDQMTWTMDYYAIGHTAFVNEEPAMLGSLISNYNIFYQIDLNDGTGFSSTKNMYYTRSGGSGTAAAFTFDVTDATGINVGDYAFGTGVATNARVVDVTGNTITVDIANIGTVSGIIRFNALAGEIIDASVGFKLKITIVTVVANTAAFTSLLMQTYTDAVSRANLYPLDPFTSSGSLNFDTLLSDGGTGYYRMYFTDLAGGDDYGTADAITVNDASGIPITGTITGGTINFSFDYSGNVQGGRTPDTDAEITVVAVNPGKAQPVVVNAVITRENDIIINLNSLADRISP